MSSLTNNNKSKITNSNLTNKNNASSEKISKKLTDRNSMPFRMAIETTLQNNYQFKNMKTDDNKEFSRFISDSVGKTISQVESLFLRTKGEVSSKEEFNGLKRSVLHFGKNRAAFRIYGYYNETGHFVIVRIDPKHNFHHE